VPELRDVDLLEVRKPSAALPILRRKTYLPTSLSRPMIPDYSSHPSLFDPIRDEFDPSRLVRSTDPETSRLAARAASRRGPNQRTLIWDTLLELGEATDYELSLATGLLRSSTAKRRQELVELGYVTGTGKTRETDTGTLAIVWRPLFLSMEECPF